MWSVDCPSVLDQAQPPVTQSAQGLPPASSRGGTVWLYVGFLIAGRRDRKRPRFS